MNLLGPYYFLHLQEGREHIFELEPLNDRIRVRIQDSGIGIAASDQEWVFERFYKVGMCSRQREIDGSGLGLAIVRKIIELHNGTI